MSAIVGGKKSRAGFARLCAVGRPWKVTAVRAEPSGRVRLELSRGKRRFAVLLRPGPTQGFFLRAGALDISFEGRRADPAASELLHGFARRLKGVEPARLLEILSDDPESTRDARPAGVKDQPDPDARCVSDRLGGNPGQWRRFFAESEFARKFFWAHPTGFRGKVLYFVHGDFDCTFMPPDLTFRGMTFLNYPPVHPHSQDAPLPDTVYDQLTSGFKETDVILGAEKKKEAFIEIIRRRSTPDDVVMISWSCTPTVIGDDEEAMAKKCREAGDCPVIVNSINFRNRKSFSLFEEIFREVRERPAFRRTRRDRTAVNLVDCSPRFFSEELAPLLAQAGIRVNARIFPAVDIPTLEHYLAASVQVVPTYLQGMPTIDRALGGLPLRTVSIPPPFGIGRTQSYLNSIARAFGKEAKMRRLWAAHRRGTRARFSEFRREAKTLRLALVAEEADLPALTRQGFLSGVPVLEMIAEMGFNVDFLIYSPEKAIPKAALALKRLPWFETPPKLHVFSNPEELTRLLENGPFRAVYSDIFFDERITRAGKAQFSMRHFETGVEGALRSLERLLGVCRLPFYKRYREYLKPEEDGG